jgi:Smg protein
MTIRILGPHERGRFAPEAWGYLLALGNSGAVSPAELEMIIERALSQIDGRITGDDLRTLLEGIGFDDGRSRDDNQTVH